MLLFKLCGFALVIFSCAFVGFLKANHLNMRVKKLCYLQKGITRFKELVRLHGGETDRLLDKCFESRPIDYSYLELGDHEIVSGLFEEIGMLDTESACNRCELCLSMLKTKYDEAQKKYRDLGKLYKSIGALTGVFICILLL